MARYDKVFRLGSGSYGCAWLVENTKQRTPRRVLKEVHLQALTEKEIEQSLTEVAVLARCKHKNIIGYIEAFVDRQSKVLSIVMDFASGGDLDKQIRQRYGLYFPNETILRWCTQLMSALQYIHERGILHRDIKPQNLFLCAKQVLKLGDFGIARILKGTSDVAVTFIGTPYYLSPEICKQQPYDHKSDLWSAGCVLYQLCCLKLPFTGENLPALAAQIQRGSFDPLPSHCGTLLCDLVNTLLMSDPNQRPSAGQVLRQNPVLQKYLKDSQQRTEDISRFERRRSAKTDCEEADTKKTLVKKLRTDDTDGDEHKIVCCGDPKKELENRINSETYTVVNHVQVRRRSLASPELSAMLEKQRSHSMERLRAASADTTRPTRKVSKGGSPRFNLLKDHQQTQLIRQRDNFDEKENLQMKGPSGELEALLQSVHQCLQTTSPNDAMSAVLKSYIVEQLGQERALQVLEAVGKEAGFTSIQDICNHDNVTLTTALWYHALTL